MTNQDESSPLGDADWEELLAGIDYEEPPEEPQEPNFINKLLARFRKPKPPPEVLEEASVAEEDEEGEVAELASPPVVEKKQEVGKRSGLLQGFTRSQKLILGVLASLVFVAVAALGVIIIRTWPASSGSANASLPDEEITVIMPSGTPIVSGGEETSESMPTPTLQALDESEAPAESGNDEEESAPSLPTNTPSPTLTPTPVIDPGVFTEFDVQVRSNPNDVDLRLQRGEAYLTMGAYTAALADFNHALSLDNTLAEAYVGLGQANYHLRQWVEAEAAFGSAISFNQDLIEPHFGLGLIYYYQARYSEASKEFDWAAEINPDYVTAEAWLSICSARLGDFAEATQALTRTLNADNELPALPIMYIARSWVRRLQDSPDLDGAQADLLYAEGLAPYDFDVLNAQARFYVDHRPERLTEAEQLAQYALNWAKEDLERARALHTLGRAYMAQGRQQDAKRVLTEAADLATSNGVVIIAELSEDLNRVYAP